MLKPVFYHNMFIIETLLVDSIITNTIVLALQYYHFLILLPIIFGYDCLYLALCVQMMFQLKRLNYRLERFPTGSFNITQEELVDFIKYHQALIA